MSPRAWNKPEVIDEWSVGIGWRLNIISNSVYMFQDSDASSYERVLRAKFSQKTIFRDEGVKIHTPREVDVDSDVIDINPK